MRALVAGWIGSTNLGDELVFSGLLTHLTDLGVEPVALSIDPVATRRRHRVEAIRHSNPRDVIGLWRHLGSSQALVFGGGGLIQSQTSPWNLPFHGSRVVAARLRRVPWGGVGLGIDPLGSGPRRLARGLFRNPVAVSARDEASAAAGRHLGLDAVVAADPALALPSPASPPTDRLVVVLRPFPQAGLGTAATKASAPPDHRWEGRMAAALDALAAHTGLETVLVALQADRDSPLQGRVAAAMTRPTRVVSPDLDTVVAEIASARLVVSMRYHGAIAALLGGVPAVLLDYSPKMGALAGDVGSGFELLAPSTDPTRLIAAADKALTGRPALAAALARLRRREAGNRQVLERLLEAAG